MNSRLGLVFGILMLVSLVSTRFVPPAPFALAASIAPFTGMFYQLAQNIKNAVDTIAFENDLRLENKTLKNQLGTALNKLAQLEQEAKKLESAAKIRRYQSPGVFAIASVISYKNDGLVSQLMVARGAQDGLQPGMAVTTPSGLVGIVQEVAQRTALIRTVTDPEFRVGVTVASKTKRGRGLGRGVAGRFLRIEGFKGSDVKVGQKVLSGGFAGGAFPSVQIGLVVKRIASRGDTLDLTLEAKPFVDPSALEEVFILSLP
jgi:rod shape-determining protein MreC